MITVPIHAELVQHFIDWTKRKIRCHIFEGTEIYFREREVWWVCLGKNIGYEADGKHEFFSRPVLVLKKYSRHMCFVLPLTTQIKIDSPFYQYRFDLNGKPNAVNLSQGRTISSKRLLQKHGVVSQEVFKEVMEKFISLLKQ